MASGPVDSSLTIRVLGEVRVARGGQTLPLPPSKKTRALLAYLVLTQRSHRRERLCSLLWDVTDDPRGALRWSVSKLRGLCDEPGISRIVADRETISFEPHAAVVDLFEVRARVANGGLERASFEELQALSREFRGELLTGLELQDFDEFQGWCVAEREQARKLQLAVLRALLECSPSAELSLPHARALVHVDPLSPSARAELVELLGRLGLHREAEQQYQTSKRLLSELGAHGISDLDSAIALARARKPPAPVSTLPPPAPPVPSDEMPTPSARGPSFVGRRSEYEELLKLLAEVARGRGRSVVVKGEAGVGKSRLLREFLARAREQGASVLSAHAYEVESGRPYGPWIDALRQVPRAAVGSRLALELSVLVPEWAPEQDMRRSEEQLFGSVSELVGSRAHTAPPVVLAFDDAHWLDEPSSRLLHYVMRMHRHRPVLILLTAREGELFDNAALTRVLRSLRRDGLAHELELGPLAAPAIEALAAELAPHADPVQLFRESGGNPLFALELARAENQNKGVLPGSLSELIRDRVEALPPQAADVLRWAAVLGVSFEISRLERALQPEHPEELTGALELLERRALIQPDTSRHATNAYAFSHEVVRRAVYAEMSEPRRCAMHRRVAEALQPLLGGDETVAGEVMHHAALAGQPEVAVAACLRAAQRCVKLFASAEAEALLRRGFFHTSKLPQSSRIPLEIELWRLQLEAKRPDDPDQVAAELQRLGELALDLGSPDAARLAFHVLSWLRWEEGAWSDAMQHSLRAEQLSRELSEPERVTALAESARCLALVERDLGTAEALLLEAGARAERCRFRPSAIADACGMLAWHRGDLPEAAEQFAEARRIARHEVDRTNEFQALEHQLCVLIELGATALASMVSDELSLLSQRLRGGSEAPLARVLAALVSYGGPTASVELEAALVALRQADAKQRLAYALLRAAELDLDQGRAELAARRAREALAAATALFRPSDVALAHAFIARSAELTHDTAELAAARKALLALPLTKLSLRARNAAQTALGEVTVRDSRKGHTPDGARRRRTRTG